MAAKLAFGCWGSCGEEPPSPTIAGMTEWKFDAPGHLSDFRDPARWHDAMASEAKDIVDILVDQVKEGQSVQDEAEYRAIASRVAYVNPLTSPPPPDAETISVQPWGAFPRAVQRRAPWNDVPDDVDPDGSFRAADHLGDEDHRAGVFVDRDNSVLHLPVRDRQDEYLEWALFRDASGSKIKRAVFVAEGYDYFSTLFRHDEQRVLEIYKEFTGIESLKVDDLRAPKGVYRRLANGRMIPVVEPGEFNPRNRFNISPGIVHLSHRANSLGAEVNLAGVSGLARKVADGSLLDGADSERLLCCAEGGNPNRNSDPLISQQAYAQVLAGYHYTLSNPVGLYIAGIDYDGLLLPDNKTSVPRDWWEVTRGVAEEKRVLRLELSVPESEKLSVGDLIVDGSKVRYGGQLAKLLTVHLFVTRWKRASDAPHGPEVRCSATCCRQIGGTTLVLSDGSCRAGFELAYPGLLAGTDADNSVLKSLSLHPGGPGSTGVAITAQTRRVAAGRSRGE